jgi:hypothetical protein
VATGAVAEVIGRAGQNVTQGKAIRIQVPSPSVANARQVLEALSNVVQVTPTGELAGWLRVEFVDGADGTSAEDYHANNRILAALIRAEIPILSFGPEGGRLQDVFLHLTEEAIK